MKHFMVDLETLDTGTDAVVLSVGIVAFDPGTKEMGAEFYVELNDENVLGQQAELNRTISESTVKWWNDQDEDARQLFNEGFGNRVPDLHDGLKAIADYFWRESDHDTDNVKVWGNGAAFDNVILRNLFLAAGLNPPWKFYNDQCYRTMKKLPGAKNLTPKFLGIKHFALDDAVHQTYHLLEIYHKCLVHTP